MMMKRIKGHRPKLRTWMVGLVTCEEAGRQERRRKRRARKGSTI
jgi:hypothetical protein